MVKRKFDQLTDNRKATIESLLPRICDNWKLQTAGACIPSDIQFRAFKQDTNKRDPKRAENEARNWSLAVLIDIHKISILRKDELMVFQMDLKTVVYERSTKDNNAYTMPQDIRKLRRDYEFLWGNKSHHHEGAVTPTLVNKDKEDVPRSQPTVDAGTESEDDIPLAKIRRRLPSQKDASNLSESALRSSLTLRTQTNPTGHSILPVANARLVATPLPVEQADTGTVNHNGKTIAAVKAEEEIKNESRGATSFHQSRKPLISSAPRTPDWQRPGLHSHDNTDNAILRLEVEVLKAELKVANLKLLKAEMERGENREPAATEEGRSKDNPVVIE